MKSLLKYVAAVALCVGLYMPDALALDSVPHGINIQGVLRNVGGEVVTGTYSMTFVLYDAVTGGNALCQNVASITVTGGVFNTSVTCPSTAFVDRTNVFLGIKVGSDAELDRIQLTSVGFAIQAEHAEQADELLGAAPDLDCRIAGGCVGSTEVSFNYAASDSKGGPATDVNCYGCVSGGAPGDIAAGSITSMNIGSEQVATGNIAAGAVTNAKLAIDSVYTGNIKDGQVTTADLATGAVTSAKLGDGAVGNTQLGVNWALGTSKGGPAADLNCTDCVSNAEVAITYAAGVDASSGVPVKNGAAANLNCLAIPGGCVEAAEVSFPYAASLTKGGAASDVSCTDCIGATEVQFNYAASATENGEASGLACTGCVGSTDMGVNYANSNSKGGDAIGLSCSTACVSTGEVDFNWAASATKGGPANDLSCTSCVVSEEIADGTIVNADISGPVTGSKITTATATDLGVVKIGSGISITSGSITPNWSLVAAKDHVHDGYFENAVDNLEIGDGKYITFLDPGGDNPGSYQARLYESTAGNAGDAGVTLVLGAQAATPDASYFQITAETGLSGVKHKFTTAGSAYHSGNLQFDGDLTCKAAGCVDSADIVNNSVTGTDILDGTITGSDLASNLSITTTGTVSASSAYASRYYDKDDTNYYADPNGTSILNSTQIYNVLSRRNTAYGLKDNGSSMSLYTSSIDAGTSGETLYIAKNTCGQIDVYGSACGSNIMTIHGTLKSSILYDVDNGSYYVDPASHSRVATFQTNTAEIPRTGTGTNYINGTTYAFNGVWYDANSTGYYIDPASTSVVNVIYGHGLRTNSWPGDPGGGNGQVAGNGADMFINPPPNGVGDIYLRNEGANKIAFNLEGNSRTSLPSFRTDGNYLVINPGTGNNNLYLNLDTNGANRFYGTSYANNLLDLGSETCQIDGGDTASTGGTRQYQIFSYYHSAYYSHITQGLRVDGTGIFVVGNGGWNTGIRMNGNTSIIPTGDGQGAVGMVSRRFAFMYSVNSVWTSERKAKKNIRYLTDRDMAAVGAAIHDLKPATWLYNHEVAKDAATTEDVEARRVRNVPHMGLILDEMPDVISNGGEGWYANDSVGFLLVASKYLDDRITRQSNTIRDLEERIATMEQILVDAGLYQ